MVKPHRVPESVFEVEFKLFEFMTMKQFVIIMITAAFATMFYFLLDQITSPFIKWLVVSLIVMFGLIVAFVKVQGEPFEVYVSNFIIALVSPQRRVWKKTSQVPSYLRDKQGKSPKQALDLAQKIKKAEKKPPPVTKEFIAETVEESAKPTKFDLIEKQYLEGKLPVFGAIRSDKEQAAENPAQTTSQHPAEAQAGIIHGTVINNNSQPLQGASVTIKDNTGKIVSLIKTNVSGKFRTGGKLATGIYSVKAEFPSLSFSATEIAVEDKALSPIIISPTQG